MIGVVIVASNSLYSGDNRFELYRMYTSNNFIIWTLNSLTASQSISRDS